MDNFGWIAKAARQTVAWMKAYLKGLVAVRPSV